MSFRIPPEHFAFKVNWDNVRDTKQPEDGDTLDEWLLRAYGELQQFNESHPYTLLLSQRRRYKTIFLVQSICEDIVRANVLKQNMPGAIVLCAPGARLVDAFRSKLHDFLEETRKHYDVIIPEIVIMNIRSELPSTLRFLRGRSVDLWLYVDNYNFVDPNLFSDRFVSYNSDGEHTLFNCSLTIFRVSCPSGAEHPLDGKIDTFDLVSTLRPDFT